MKPTPSSLPAHLLVLGLLAVPFFTNLGVSSLWDANESFYAETPREMLESGDWVLPTFNGQPRAQKPPLTYWAVALSYRVFGVGEFAVRFPGALAAAGVLILVYFSGRLLFTPQVGLLAAAITGTTVRVLVLARRLPIDILLLLWLVATAYFLLRGIVRHSTASWALAYVCAALGFLTKGPVALVIPFGACLAWSWGSRQLPWRRLHPLLGAAILAAVVLPWYWMAYDRAGWEYIGPFFMRDNLGRFAGELMGPGRGPLYYVTTYLADYFPWSVLSLAVLGILWRERRQIDARRHIGWGFPMLWSLLVMLLFTLAKNKQEYYIVPVYPMMSLVIAAVVLRPSPENAGGGPSALPAAWRIGSIAGAALLGLLAALAPAGIRAGIPGASAVMQYGPSLLLFGAAAALVWSLMHLRMHRGVAALLVPWWLLCASIPLVFLPAIEPLRPVKSMCEALRPRLEAGDHVGYFRTTVPSMAFYLRRPIFEEFDAEQMVKRFASERRIFCVLAESDRKYFMGERGLILYVLDRRPRFASRLRDLLDRSAWRERDLALVSNRPVASAAGGDRQGR